MLVSIDPGVRLAGVACWDDGELTNAFLVKGRDWLTTAGEVQVQIELRFPSQVGGLILAIERPQVYVQSKQKGDPNDLITVALMVGAVATLADDVVTYLPREWKGSAPKDVMVERIKRRLTPEEHARIDLPRAKSLHHNIWDAVGIGLHHLKRR